MGEHERAQDHKRNSVKPGRNARTNPSEGEVAMKRIIAVVAAASLALLGSGLATAPSAGAYGSAALWQIGLSFNCNNPSLCGSELGGFWGWAEFDSDNTADAQLVGCGHLQGGRAQGAQHFSVDAHSWTGRRGASLFPIPFAQGLPT